MEVDRVLRPGKNIVQDNNKKEKMTCHSSFLVISLMLAVSLVNAVDFPVFDNTGDSPGGRRFRNEIGGISYAGQSLRAATDFTWRVFRQTNNPSDRRTTQSISLSMENSEGVAYSSQDKIHFNAGYLVGVSGDVKKEFTRIVYHEVVHSWQWNGAGKAPSGLIEGIADFVTLKAGYAVTARPGGGDRWDQGYGVTARFLDYCNDLRNGFVADLNMKMKSGYSDGFFVELLGKDVNQLWREYKAKYGQ